MWCSRRLWRWAPHSVQTLDPAPRRPRTRIDMARLCARLRTRLDARLLACLCRHTPNSRLHPDALSRACMHACTRRPAVRRDGRRGRPLARPTKILLESHVHGDRRVRRCGPMWIPAPMWTDVDPEPDVDRRGSRAGVDRCGSRADVTGVDREKKRFFSNRAYTAIVGYAVYVLANGAMHGVQRAPVKQVCLCHAYISPSPRACPLRG